MATVAVTTVCWLITAYVAPQTDRDVLVDFYLKTRPAGPGWAAIRSDPRVAAAGATASLDNIPMALIGWVAGTALVWSALFTVGNFLYGRMGTASALLAVTIVSGLVVLWVVSRLWVGDQATDQSPA
jgi:hypothetical protein